MHISRPKLEPDMQTKFNCLSPAMLHVVSQLCVRVPPKNKSRVEFGRHGGRVVVGKRYKIVREKLELRACSHVGDKEQYGTL